MPSSAEGSDYTPSDGGSLGGSYDSQDSESDDAARSDGEQSLASLADKSKTVSSKGSPSPPSTVATIAKKDALTPPMGKKANVLADLRRSMARISHGHNSDDSGSGQDRHSSDSATPVSPASSPVTSPPRRVAPAAAPVHHQTPAAPAPAPPKKTSKPPGPGEQGLPKKPSGRAKPKVHPGQKWRGWSKTFPHWYKYPLPKQTPVGPDREDWAPHYPRLLSSNRDWWQNGRPLDGIYRAETVPGRMLSPGGDWGRAGYRMGEIIANQAAPPTDLSREHRASTPRRNPCSSPTTCSQAVRQRLQWNVHEPTMPSAAAMARGYASSGGYPSPGQSRSLTPR